MDSRSSKANPCSRSITSTRRVTSSGWGRAMMKPRWPSAAKDCGHVEHVLGLEAEVELLGDRLGEQLDQCRRVGERGDRDASDQERGQPRHDLEVRVDLGADRGPLDLDHDLGLAAWSQTGGVDLGDRGRGERRRASKSVEDLLERAHRGPPRPHGAPSSKDSARTWSRQRLNSSTSSEGKSPSPLEMIWPSLM